VKNILITGASRGLGQALAQIYAQEGRHLFLLSRDKKSLKKVAQACEKKGAVVSILAIDVTDQKSMSETLMDLDHKHPLDMVIVNAGVGTQGKGETPDHVKNMISVNFMGALHTVQPLIEPMKERGKGQIAFISSLVGIKALPQRGVYGATKGAVRLYGEALRQELKPFGIDVNVVCPGFIRTSMISHIKTIVPYLMGPEQAALAIQKGLEKNQARIAFPWQIYGMMIILTLLPQDWVNRLIRRFLTSETK
jgi:short-subunit dehydrogenase